MSTKDEIRAPEEKSEGGLSDGDWKSIAEYGVDTKNARATERSDLEKQWDEVDRQIAMRSKPSKDDPAWMPDIEMPLQAEALETLTADCRRLMFPSDREWFTTKSALRDTDLANLNFQGFIGQQKSPVEQAIAMGTPQDFADHLPTAFLQKMHGLYDFRGAVDDLNCEAYKRGSFCGEIKWMRPDLSDDYAGARKKPYPRLVPLDMRNTYLDDSPAKLFLEGIEIGPLIVRTFVMHIDDLRLAASKGKTDVTDPNGGWRPEAVAGIEAKEEKGVPKDHVRLLMLDGDLIVPRSEGAAIYLPNVRVTICEQGPTVVRYRERDLPFSPFISGPYHRDTVGSPYATSPLVKSVPLHNGATRALKEFLAGAALWVRPPVTWNPHDQKLRAMGGPKIAPGAMWDSLTKPEMVKVGDPTPILNGFQVLVTQFQEMNGTMPTRLGQQTKSHQSAFAVDVEQTRGQLRTVDYVGSTLSGAMKTLLHMEYAMCRTMGAETIQVPDYSGFVVASGKNLPETVEFSITGAGAPIEERERRAAKIQALQAIAQLSQIAVASGGKPADINMIQEEIARLGGLDNFDKIVPGYITAAGGGTPGAPPGLPANPFVGQPISPAPPGLPAG